MSEVFERRLADHVYSFLETRPPQPGQILLGEFHSASVSDRFTNALVDLLGERGPPLLVDDEQIELPTYVPEDGVPTYLVRVVPEVTTSNPPPYLVSQGFATKMRNLVADSVYSDDPRAMLMIIETDATIDTLEASEELFSDSGPVNLDTFRRELFDTSDLNSPQSRALLRGLRPIIEDDPLHAQSINVLEELSKIRESVEQGGFDELPELIGGLPHFIREDFFNSEEFKTRSDEGALKDAVKNTLKDNAKHAETLRRAHDTGVDTHSRLTSNYDEEFVGQALEAPDWSKISHTEARKAEITYEKIRFDQIDIEARRERIFDPLENTSRTRKSLLLVADNGTVRVAAEFIKDVEDTPYECINPNGNSVGTVSKRRNRITTTLEGLEPDRPHYAQLLIYVGKKTTQGKPTHQFDIAVVPEWFYQTSEDISLDIDVESSTFLAPGDQKLTLIPPERLDTQHEEKLVEVTEDGQFIELTGSVTLDPDPPGVLERVTCQIAPPEEIPISLTFLLDTVDPQTQDIILPLHLAAIVDPEEWSGEELFVLPELFTVDTNRGAIYTATDQGITLQDGALELLQYEEHIINERDPRARIVEGDSLGFGTVNEGSELPDPLQEAYEGYFELLDEREVTPSTDRWDEESQEKVSKILETYEESVNQIGKQTVFSLYEPLKDLGTIRSPSNNIVWHTPFHPISLVYGLKLAQWRDDQLVGNAKAGFRREEFISKFNPTGLLPYRTSKGDSQQLLRGMPLDENLMWQVYSAVESPTSVTPSFMDRVVRDKLFTFVQAFPLLFKLHPERQLVINLINLGDLRSFIKGLFEFYKKIDSSEFHPPTILLRIYGGPEEGDALSRFFSESARSRLLTQLEKQDDEIVDVLRKNVRFIHARRYSDDTQKPAHITFFRGLLQENIGTLTRHGELPSGMLFDGLFPRESIDTDAADDNLIYTVGFSSDEDETSLAARTAKVANSLEAGYFTNSYNPKAAPKKNVEPTHGTDLNRIWDDSLWVIHVQPNVGIDFYLQSNVNGDSPLGKLMIHYSDQYDASSPNFDVITSTDKRRPYEMSLQQTIEESNLSGQLDPEKILSTLVAIDGELALKLQRATDNEVVEYVGFAGGLALSRSILNHHYSDHVWIPISLNELTRHDRAYRHGQSGLLQPTSTGKSSDDLCFVGVPIDSTDRTLKLWIVETKGGTSNISTGRKQVEGAVDNLSTWFVPSRTYADERLLYAEFGKLVLDVARRMSSYDVLDDSSLAIVDMRWRQLLEGDYQISFITDTNGRIGEVIRIRTDQLVTKVHLDNKVRAIEAPLKALKLLDNDSLEEILPDLSLEDLAFQAGVVPDIETQPSQPVGTDVEARVTPTEVEEVDIPSDDPDDSATPDEFYPKEPTRPTAESDQLDSSEADAEQIDEDETPHESIQEGASEPTLANSSTASNVPHERDLDSSQYDEPASQRRIEQGLKLLTPSPSPETDIDPGQLASELAKAFESLGIEIHPPNPSSVSIGPRKVGIDIIPKEGQKVESIIRNLDTLSVHIKAQGDIVGTRVPAKGAVHLEIPHGDPRDIYLREGVASIAEKSVTHEPLVPIGVDTDNVHHSLSLLEERHLLIGGATGSGKSNFLSTVIASLALTADPEQVQLSILDPKGVDFGRFAELPHVTKGGYFDTPESCTNHLLTLVNSMVPERQEYLSAAGVSSVSQLYEFQDQLEIDPLPYHVIVIDEYADLIMSVDDEDVLEDAVTRLAQIGRALGIVVLLATQRPSADIVSGKIKANFPCRVSFRLPSNTDSRVILDEPGAEDLQGSGDMIVFSQSGKRLNLQGYLLTPMDAMQIVEYLSASD